MTSESIYEKFISNPADVEIGDQTITIKLKKKRDLLMVLENMSNFNELKIPWLNNKQLRFEGATYFEKYWHLLTVKIREIKTPYHQEHLDFPDFYLSFDDSY